MKRFLTFFGAALGCLFVLVLFAGIYVVMTAKVSVSSVSTLKTGRTVTAESDDWSGISVADSFDSATIETNHYTIVVAPTKLIVDNRVVARIDEDVKRVAVRMH